MLRSSHPPARRKSATGTGLYDPHEAGGGHTTSPRRPSYVATKRADDKETAVSRRRRNSSVSGPVRELGSKTMNPFEAALHTPPQTTRKIGEAERLRIAAADSTDGSSNANGMEQSSETVSAWNNDSSPPRSHREFTTSADAFDPGKLPGENGSHVEVRVPMENPVSPPSLRVPSPGNRNSNGQLGSPSSKQNLDKVPMDDLSLNADAITAKPAFPTIAELRALPLERLHTMFHEITGQVAPLTSDAAELAPLIFSAQEATALRLLSARRTSMSKAGEHTCLNITHFVPPEFETNALQKYRPLPRKQSPPTKAATKNEHLNRPTRKSTDRTLSSKNKRGGGPPGAVRRGMSGLLENRKKREQQKEKWHTVNTNHRTGMGVEIVLGDPSTINIKANGSPRGAISTAFASSPGTWNSGDVRARSAAHSTRRDPLLDGGGPGGSPAAVKPIALKLALDLSSGGGRGHRSAAPPRTTSRKRVPPGALKLPRRIF